MAAVTSAPRLSSAVPAPSASAVMPSATVSAPVAPPSPSTAPPRLTLPTEGQYAVVDLHVDTPWKVHFKGRPLSLPEGHATPDRLRDGHYAGLVFPIYIPDYLHNNRPTIADADAIFGTIDALVKEHGLFYPAVPGPVPTSKIGVFVSIEGAGAFADDITQIDRFIARGVRLVGPVHANDNKLASSATGKTDRGLSALGKQFCERVYEAGALIDVSHLSDRGFAELVPIAKRFGAPIVASHSNARAVAAHPRNLTDEQLRRIALTGGVAGLNFHRSFVRRSKAVRMADVLAQIDHMRDVAGVDHIAIGSDFDGANPVSAVADASKMPALAEAMRQSGWADEAIRKVFGRNALRVLSWGLPAKP